MPARARLAGQGIEVHAIVPRGKDQRATESEEGVQIHSFPLSKYLGIGEIISNIDADIYHSQDPTPGTVIAMRAKPDSKHIMTCQNPKTKEDWKKVNRFYPFRRRVYNSLIEPLVSKKINELDQVFCQCRYIGDKADKCYGLGYEPDFLPNPVSMLNDTKKEEEAKVCFLGRFDGERKPERFFELAEKLPEVSFVAAGRSHDISRDKQLREKHQTHNLSLPGHLSGREKDQLLESSWILVNTSVSECLPVSFLEAASAGCAILSPHDPDGFASSFGYQVNEDYVEGIQWLLEGDRWRMKGKSGRAYVKRHHEYNTVVNQHIQMYRELLG